MKTTDEAVSRYSASIGHVVACVTPLRHGVRPFVSYSRRAYEFSPALPVALRSIDGGRSEYRFDFQLVGLPIADREMALQTSRTETIAYEYRLLDHRDRELLVYHWHPDAAGPDNPHLHVSATLDVQVDALTRRSVGLDKRHLVTGQVSLGAFIRMLITEFDVRPLRADWRERLADPLPH